MNQQRNRQLFAGLAIIVLGSALWALQHFENLGPATVFFVVSACFFTGYFIRREEGLLIPAGIVGGFALSQLETIGLLLGLGCGFLAITGVALVYQRKFISWPLVPGTILVLLGIRQFEIIDYLFENWPLLLIGIGVLIVLAALFRRDPKEV